MPLFKKGKASHSNNVELGKNGHWRSNVWTYPGPSSMGSEARQGLQDHPTVKPICVLEDALLDMTERGDIASTHSSVRDRRSSLPKRQADAAAVSSLTLSMWMSSCAGTRQ